jgi:phosphonopyruvate decarboxylase
MIDCQTYFELLRGSGIEYFAGVPDSLLKDFCAYVYEHVDPSRNLIAANEGAAVALAAGHYLATGELSLVYMQNSGLGNAINPLTSLVDPAIYGIPSLLLIGWRGEPGRTDEPQHVKQGAVTLDTLGALKTRSEVLADTIGEAAQQLDRAVAHLKDNSAPFALVVRAGTFGRYENQAGEADRYEMRREDAIIEVASHLSPEDVIVSTTGKASRELFEHRAATGGDHAGDFLTVGSMGHASQIALGIALSRPERQVICLDGDGAVIMHMGALAIIGSRCPANFKHVVINNGSHDSVGGQPTAAFDIDLPAIARGCGYRSAWRVRGRDDVTTAVREMRGQEGPVLLEIMTNPGARANLGRPTIAPAENKLAFMKNMS